MPWQIIIVLLALTAVGWWLWRRLDAHAAELGPRVFEDAPQPTNAQPAEPLISEAAGEAPKPEGAPPISPEERI